MSTKIIMTVVELYLGNILCNFAQQYSLFDYELIFQLKQSLLRAMLFEF